MKRITFLFLLAALLIPLLTSRLLSVDLKKGKYVQSAPAVSELSVTVNLLGEKGGVYRPGKEIGVSFQTTKDAYVFVYNVDSEGYVHLLYPEDGSPVLSEGRKTYFLPEPGKSVYWETGDKTGVEYIHAVAVADRNRINEDELYFLSQNDRLSEEKRFRIDLDPFLAFNMIDEELVNGAETAAPATDYTYFYINSRVEYPRYLCSKCHSPEKIPDPYAMECSEIVIEKVAYDEDPHYPYPPLYDVRNAGEEATEDDSYSSEGSGEDANDNDDTDVYLSFSSGSYDYPYRSWPYYGGYYGGFSPVYYDPFWWNFGWSIYWGDSYWGPGYGWGAPPYGYWAYHNSYPWWDNNHRWYGCDREYRCDYRPVYAERTLVKRRFLDYALTNKDVRRTRALTNSRLVKTRTEKIVQRLERSTLQKRAIERNVDRGALIRGERSAAKSRETDRRVIYGGERMQRGMERDVPRTVRPRETQRSREGTGTRAPRSGRTTMDRSAPPKRDDAVRDRSTDSRRDVIRKAAPERRSSDREREVAPRSRSGNSPAREKSGSDDRSRSTVDRRRTSTSSPSPSAPARSVGRSSAPSSNRSSSPSPSRGSAPSSAPSRGSSSHAGGKSRTR